MKIKVVALLGLLAVLAGGTASAGRPAARWIVFPASPDNGTDGQHLYRVRLDGGGLQQLTFGHGTSVDPAFSPDGKRVVYAGGGLFVINLDGSGWRRLTPNPCDHMPTWSPDGTRIAFVRCHHLYVMRADGKRPRRLPYAPAPVGRPSWRPGGRIFVAAAAIPGATQLAELSAGDGHVKRRLRFEVLARPDQVYPALSPDGKLVAFLDLHPCADCRYEEYGLYLGSASASKARFIDGGIPSWSPDSKRLIYNYRGAFNVRSVATGIATPITGLPSSLIVSGPVAWQPR